MKEIVAIYDGLPVTIIEFATYINVGQPTTIAIFITADGELKSDYLWRFKKVEVGK